MKVSQIHKLLLYSFGLLTFAYATWKEVVRRKLRRLGVDAPGFWSRDFFPPLHLVHQYRDRLRGARALYDTGLILIVVFYLLLIPAVALLAYTFATKRY